MVLVNWK